MIVRILLIIALCLQAQSVFPMMEPIEKDKQHVAKQADDLSAMDTNDVPSIGELYAMQNREKLTQKEKEERAIKEAMLLDAKKYPGIEIRTIARDEIIEINNTFASLRYGLEKYHNVDSEQKVCAALNKLFELSQKTVEKIWDTMYPRVLATAKAACKDAKMLRSGEIFFACKCKTCITCLGRSHDMYAILQTAHFNLECIKKIDKMITERKEKYHGKEK